MAYVDQTHLREVLTRYYSEGELRILCSDLGIDYESLGGRGKAENALELVNFAIRKGYYDAIVAYVRRTRPHVSLKMTDKPPVPPEAVERPFGSAIIQVQGDYLQGDKFGGDKVEGNKTTISNVSGGNVAVGDGASAGNTQGDTYNVGGNVIGGVVGSGTVNAQNIAGGDMNINANPQDKADFAEQLQELKVLLEKALAEGEFAHPDDGETAVDDLDKAIKETEKDQPRSQQVQRRLESVAELIQSGAKVGTAVLKATPVIAGLIKAAGLLF